MRAYKSSKVQTVLRLTLEPTAVFDSLNLTSLSFYILTIADIGQHYIAFALAILICFPKYLSPAGNRPTNRGS